LYATRLALTLALTLAAGDGPGALPQAVPVTPPQGGRVAVSNSNRDVGRYEAMYGKPEFRALDDLTSRPWPTRRAIRTVGRLEPIPGRGRRGGDSKASDGIASEWDNAYALYRICAEPMICLALVPVEEMQSGLDTAAHAWLHQQVEVIGAIDKLDLPGIDPRTAPTVFLIWSVFEAPDRPTRKTEDGAAGSSLEPLVRYPKGAEGRVVTVSGTFRGSNLFEDLPPESRRRSDDWVLKDGPFSIWVSGKPPRGKGWSLDPQSRSDCTWRIEATGKVESVGGILYLRPSQLLLKARAKPE